MTRTLRGLALVVILAFAIGGCAQPVQQTGAKKGKRDQVAAKKPGAKETAPTPSQPDAAKPGEPETTKPVTPDRAKPGRTPPPPPFGPPVSKRIDAAKVGIPLYPGVKVISAVERTWPGGEMAPVRTASCTSTDDPEKIIKWYQAKLGPKAKAGRSDQNADKRAFFYLSDTEARLVKSAMVKWAEETPGEPGDVTVDLTVREFASKPAK